MQKAKKLIGLALAVGMTVTMVAGCGSNGSSTDSTAPSTTADSSTATATTSETKALDPVELQWYVIGNGQPKDMDAVLAKVNEKLKAKINASLKLNIFTWGDDFEQKMGAKVQSGEKFDITFTSNWALNYIQNSAKGAFIDLTPMLDQYAPKTKAQLGDNIIKGASINGKLYALPTLKEMAHNWGFLINKKMADKNGIDLSTIKKFEDIEPALKIIKDKEGANGVEAFQTLTGESAYRVLDFEKIADDYVPGAIYGDGRDTKVLNDFDTPEAKSLYNTLHKWYLAGYIRKDADTVTDYAPARKAGKVFSAVASLKPGKDAEQSLADGIEWKQIDLTKPVSTTREMIGAMQAISKTSANPERALMFLELMNTDPEICNLVNFGIEGTHYTKVAGKDNVYEQTQQGKDGYNVGTPWMFANQFNTLLAKTEDPEKWTKFKEYNSNALVSPILGFTFNTEPVKTKVAALTSVRRQFMPGLETGKSDPAVMLPKFTDKLKQAGMDDVLKEMQKQVDAFLAAKK
jgi:putative aldouronate transport system substrate-binding protein